MSQQTQATLQAQPKTAEPVHSQSSILQRAAISPTITLVHSPILQRCSNGVECEECRQKRLGTLQRAAVNSTPTNANGVPPIVHDVLNSPGRALDSGTRAFMEPRFGHDFSGVRVHTDTASGQAAQALGAYAYTIGQDIYFAPGRYDPSSSDGKRLLAHELTHTVQQRSATTLSTQTAMPIDQLGSPLEREADNAAEAVLSGAEANVLKAAPTLIPQLDGPDDGRATAVRPIKGGHIEVVRTLKDQHCTRVPESQSDASVYFDPDLNALGIRYHYCRGSVDVKGGSEASVNYDQLRRDAERLLEMGGTGKDLLSQIEDVARKTHLSARTKLALTVSGTLQIELSGGTQQGLTTRTYDAEGLLRLTPQGWNLEIKGGGNYIENERGNIKSITFTSLVNVGRLQTKLTVARIEQQPKGAASTSSTELGGDIGVRVVDRFGVIFSGKLIQSGSGTISSVSLGVGTIDSPPTVPSVDCYTCKCPPPKPEYTCTTVMDPTTKNVIDQPGGHELVTLSYKYDKAVPENKDAYNAQIRQIVGFIQQSYTIKKIEGFASPEASIAYNKVLAHSRSLRAQSDISTALSKEGITTALPLETKDEGELLGQGSSGGETLNRELSKELSARLRDLSVEEQFELLGIDASKLSSSEKVERQREIDAFIKGSEGGRFLTQRGRWEKIFPFLRRVEVWLNRQELSHAEKVPGSQKTGDCDTETLDWAEKNMPEIPRNRRLPSIIPGSC